MGVVERRTAGWVDLVGDLLAQPIGTFPGQVVATELHRTFGCQVVRHWTDEPGGTDFEAHLPMADWPTPELKTEMIGALPHHPIQRWMRITSSLAPITTRRVPRAMVTAPGRRAIADFLLPVGMEHHLAVVYRNGTGVQRAFVLAQGGSDFTDEDLRVATAIQPLLTLLERQISVLGCANMTVAAAAYGLTGRELAVLQLLARGLTASAIGARLAISERTVHRHLHGVYRKLGARDRLTVVLIARDAGLLPDRPADAHQPPEIA